jgi:hypothetical protein
MKNTPDNRKSSPKNQEKGNSFFGKKETPFFGKKRDNKSTSFEELDSKTKKHLSDSMNTDFTDVEIHYGEKGDQITSEQNALAVTYGKQIFVKNSEFRPGTDIGDSLLAHEMAHVAQQSNANESDQLIPSASNRELEKDANFSMIKYILGIKFGLRGNSEKSKVKSGLRFSAMACDSNRIEPPSYLGPHSIRALEDINRVIENTDLLAKVVAVGVAVNVGLASPEETIATRGPEDTIMAATEALRGIPAIRRNRVHMIIDLLFLDHENDMNDQEKAFWERIRSLF